ncbi:hypothetical protein ACKWTF_002555 [Chironomus riparius]
MSDNLVIETRSRSRSKTPGLLSNENGDSKGAKKIPTVSLIEEEEDVIGVSSQPSQRPKRQRRSAKNATSDTSGDTQLETVVSNSKQSKSTVTATTTTTIIQTSKQTTNGTQEKSEESTSVKTITHTASNNDATEFPESQSIFNNIFNAIKTSTPILSTKRTKRTTLESSSSTGNVDFNLHPAYKEYKEAGEYWNKFPKTDYTYSELSPHRRELGAGIVAMPNMSRKSLDKYQNRIEAMIQQNPTEESFIRRKFLSNMSYQKKAADLQYDSADEVDVSDLYKNLSARRNSEKNVFSRFIMFVIGVFSSSYSNLKRKVSYGSKQHISYTPIKRHHQQGFWRGIYNFAQSFVLLCISKVYLFISTVLCLDTWLLYTRSENVHQNQKRKRFLIGLLVLLPLMLFGAFLLSEDNNFIARKNYRLERFNYKLNYVTQYFSDVSLPSIPHFNFGWILSPLFYTRALFRGFIMDSTTKQPELKLDEERLNIILKHINDYVDNTIQEKLKLNNDILINKVNERLVITIANHLNDALKKYEYRLTAKDVEIIVNQIKVQLNNDLNEKEKSILAKISLNNQENVEKIKSIASLSMSQQKNTQNIDLDKIITMILESKKLPILIDDRIKIIHNSDVEKIKLEIIGKFAVYDNELNRLKVGQTSISDDLIRFKRENDDGLKSILMKIDDKFTTFSDYSSIDMSVRKSLLNILGLKNPEIGDETLLKEWIENTFVAKIYLEQHLQNLNLKLNEAFSKEIDKNAGIFMEDINEKLKSQIKILLEQKNEEHKSTNLNIRGGILTEDDVIKIVKDILAVYDADKTGLVDYGLESAGGEIISTRCTENYRTKSAEISIFGIPIWYPRNTPRTVISPTIAPGECWAFQGFPGFLVIKLSNLIKVTGFTVEHIPQSNAPNNVIDSAPNNFSVWGLTSEFDKNPILFGNYYYSASKDAPSLQYFPVQNKDIVIAHQFVELVIESNHGNSKYTCLYRFRVHGEM